MLWQNEYPSGIHASPSVADFDQDGKPEVLAAWSYGQVAIFDGRTGTPRWLTRLEQDDGGIEGLFGSPIPVPGKPGCGISLSDSILSAHKGAENLENYLSRVDRRVRQDRLSHFQVT